MYRTQKSTYEVWIIGSGPYQTSELNFAFSNLCFRASKPQPSHLKITSIELVEVYKLSNNRKTIHFSPSLRTALRLAFFVLMGSFSYPRASAFYSSLNPNGRSSLFFLASAVLFPQCPLNKFCCVSSSVGQCCSLLRAPMYLELICGTSNVDLVEYWVQNLNAQLNSRTFRVVPPWVELLAERMPSR